MRTHADIPLSMSLQLTNTSENLFTILSVQLTNISENLFTILSVQLTNTSENLFTILSVQLTNTSENLFTILSVQLTNISKNLFTIICVQLKKISEIVFTILLSVGYSLQTYVRNYLPYYWVYSLQTYVRNYLSYYENLYHMMGLQLTKISEFVFIILCVYHLKTNLKNICSIKYLKLIISGR